MASGTIQTSGVTKNLIWENPDPTASFTAQTLSLDLSSYDELVIDVISITSTPRHSNHTVYIDGKTWVLYSMQKSSNDVAVRYRMATVTATGITFTTGYSGGSDGSSFAVPVKIYGIKGLIR